MAPTLTTTSDQIPARSAVSTRWRERLFFTALPVAVAVTVFVGFADTYYLKTLYGTPPLSLLLHVHGLVFSTWLVLLIVQTSLVASGRTDVHRRLGVFGGVLAALMVVLALAASIDMGRRGSAPPGVPPLSFMFVPFATVIVFPVLIGSALAWRRRVDIHKRLMLIGTLELLPAGVARWPGIPAGPVAFFGLSDLFLLLIVAYDIATRGRPHRATVWGGLFLVSSQVLRVVASGTDAWLAFAAWLIR